MIHDKDFMIRQIKQFSEFIAAMLLGKNEGKPQEVLLVFETHMKNVFKMSFEELSVKSFEEIESLISGKEDTQKAVSYELLGHLFYFKFKETGDTDLGEKSKYFYNLWQKKSKIFSMDVIKRLEELQ